MNKIFLIGNVGQDPEIKTFENGGKMAKFSIATTERWLDKTGQKAERTTWHFIQVTKPGLVKVVEQWVKKGMKMAIEGCQHSRDWTDERGTTRRMYFVTVETMEMLSRAKSSDQNTSTDEFPPDDDLPF